MTQDQLNKINLLSQEIAKVEEVYKRLDRIGSSNVDIYSILFNYNGCTDIGFSSLPEDLKRRLSGQFFNILVEEISECLSDKKDEMNNIVICKPV